MNQLLDRSIDGLSSYAARVISPSSARPGRIGTKPIAHSLPPFIYILSPPVKTPVPETQFGLSSSGPSRCSSCHDGSNYRDIAVPMADSLAGAGFERKTYYMNPKHLEIFTLLK